MTQKRKRRSDRANRHSRTGSLTKSATRSRDANKPAQRQVQWITPDSTGPKFPAYEIEGQPCPEVLLDGPEVKEYADFESMCRDFEQVITMCMNAKLISEDRSLDARAKAIGQQATWESAVMAYARAFKSGVSVAPSKGGRTRFPQELLDALDAEQRGVHRRTLELRDKHVGHRVNDWAQVTATAVLSPEGNGEPRILDVVCRGFTIIGGSESADHLLQVASVLREGLLHRIHAIKADIIAQLRHVPLEDLYAASKPR